MRSGIDAALVNDCCRFVEPLKLLYLNNPKAACSTIKHSLWKAADRLTGKNTYKEDIHDRKGSPFVEDLFARNTYSRDALADARIFSVVRNPYVRILSAYLDKIGGDPEVWRPFAKRFGIRLGVGQAQLTFADFLRVIVSEPDELLNSHFRPQYLNLLFPLSKPCFVGQLENWSETVAYLHDLGVCVEDHRVHATHAAENLQRYYTEECVDLVKQKYRDDFELFGYSTEIAEHTETRPIHLSQQKDDRIKGWLADSAPPADTYDSAAAGFFLFGVEAAYTKRLAHVRKNYVLDDNWRRLHGYALYALRTENYELGGRIIERIVELRSRHKSLVENKDIFY